MPVTLTALWSFSPRAYCYRHGNTVDAMAGKVPEGEDKLPLAMDIRLYSPQGPRRKGDEIAA